MSEVFREITLEWQDQEYRMVPSANFLRRIKGQHGINHMALAHTCTHGGADPLDMALVHRLFLNEAGAPVTDDESYLFMISGDAKRIRAFQMAYISAVLPSIDLGKKPEAPSQPEPEKPKARRKRT